MLLCSLSSCLTFCQQDRQEIASQIIDELSNLGSSDYSYFLALDEETSTIEFVVNKGQQIIELYRLLLQDVHPEGVFILEKDSKLQLKILSRNHSGVFIHEKYKNGLRLSSNIKFIEYGNFSIASKEKLKKIVKLFKKLLPSEVKVKPTFVEPPRTKKN